MATSWSEVRACHPAFPLGGDSPHQGLTVRDYFAAAALQGLLAAETEEADLTYSLAAKFALGHADALLAALYPDPVQAHDEDDAPTLPSHELGGEAGGA